MRQILTFNLIFACVLSLTFPAQDVFAQRDVLPPVIGQSTSNLAPAGMVVSVVRLSAPTAVSTAQTGAPASQTCQAPAGESSNLVQDPGLVNLNQPASCFNLQILPGQILPRVLSVVPLQAMAPTLVVVSLPALAFHASLAPAPLGQPAPILPLTMFAAVFGFYSRRKQLEKNILALASRAKVSLTLHQLQVLRC